MKCKISLLFLFMLLVLGLHAQDVPKPMYPYRLVNDFSNVFSSTQAQALENKLRAYNDTTSTQVYVITVNDLGGYAISDYAFVLGEKWGIGQVGKDNGLIILIKPKVGNSRGQAFVATGYGLEAYITDAFAGRIVRDYMIPYFIDDDYYGGVNAAVDVVIAKLSGEFDADNKVNDVWIPLWFKVLVLLIIFIVLASLSGRKNKNGGGGNKSSRGPVFYPPVIRGGGRSSWGGNSSGGGFGGGGGGRFGGGGAGGSW